MNAAMKRKLKITGGLLFALLGAIQFVQPARNTAAGPGPDDINVKHPVPPPVLSLLQGACYDCHSNNTVYPWYARVQPVGWWLARHVQDGRRHLDFSAFGTYPPKRAASKLNDLVNELEQHSMPLPSYTWMHPAARLTPAQVKLITDWAEGLEDEISPP